MPQLTDIVSCAAMTVERLQIVTALLQDIQNHYFCGTGEFLETTLQICGETVKQMVAALGLVLEQAAGFSEKTFAMAAKLNEKGGKNHEND